MNFLYEQIERVAKSTESAGERAVAAGKIANAALSKIYERAGAAVPEGDSMLAKLNGEPARAFFRERGELRDGVNFVRILRDNARHGRRIKRSEADSAVAHVYQLLDALKGGAVRPRHLTERETRLQYVDVFLEEAGWEVMTDKGGIHYGKACVEIRVTGMAPTGQDGYCDYVLFGRDNRPLAVVEAKKTIENSDKGRQQVRLYGDCLERQYGVKPVLYYTNGHDIWVDDRIYPERRVAAFHALDDLERLVQRQTRGRIEDMRPDPGIAGRPYQLTAVKAVCERLDRRERHGLLVMATGTGKTRTVISIVDVLTRHDWVKNVLFLADRTELVKQAYKAFAALLPQMTYDVPSQPSLANDPQARVTLSTYQTMIRRIDGDEKGYKSGHFDLIVVDEAHRSVFNKYGVIFDYFDALMLGLTATPREQVDASTYELFRCEQGVPDYSYGMEQAFKEGYLKPWKLFNRTTAVLRDGIRYDDLSAAERELYEKGFDEAGQARPDMVAPDEVFRAVYNRKTCARVLEELMTGGQKVEGGELLGKTIVFAANHEHAVMVKSVFDELYPELASVGYCQLIDNKIKFADTLVDEFKEKKYPRIAVSVDMLDTGIDVPEALNLVYFRKVRSKIKFFQMLGRGTRPCSDVFGHGRDKERFFVFDYCGNFDYFIGEGGQGTDELDATVSLSQRVFTQRVRLMLALQAVRHQAVESRRAYWKELHDIVAGQIRCAKANICRVSVRKVLPDLERFAAPDALRKLDAAAVERIERKVAPVIEGDIGESPLVKGFDVRMLAIETAAATTGSVETARGSVLKVREAAKRLMELGAIDEVRERRATLERMADSGFWRGAGLEEIERLRRETRSLMVHLKGAVSVAPVFLNLSDEIVELPVTEGEADYRTYREKLIDYLQEHSDVPAVRKLARMEKMDRRDFAALEDVLWREIGTKDDFDRAKLEARHEGTVWGFVRSLAGLDEEALQVKFGAFLNDHSFSMRQHEFFEAIVDYVRENGEVTASDLANKPPFDDLPYIEVFADRMADLTKLIGIIKETFPDAA